MPGSWAPEDFLLFSPRVYWRLFALENAAVWPAQILLLAAGAALLFGLLRGWIPAGRSINPVLRPALVLALAAAWLWAGWQFVALRYGAINWAAPMLAWGFYAEGALLAALGLSGRLDFAGRGKRAGAGTGLFAVALLAWPLLAPLDGRPWQEAEIIALAPDPTTVATLALIALAPRTRWTALLAAVPGLWLALSALTLFTMGAWQGWAVLAALLAGLAACAAPERRTAAGQ